MKIYYLDIIKKKEQDSYLIVDFFLFCVRHTNKVEKEKKIVEPDYILLVLHLPICRTDSIKLRMKKKWYRLSIVVVSVR